MVDISNGSLFDQKLYTTSLLSNDSGKVESNFFCYAAMCFPHIGMFSFFTQRMQKNLLKGRLCDKMYFQFHFEKGVFLC